jgi:hypothetical protein
MWLMKGRPDGLAGFQLLLAGVLVVAPLWALFRVAYRVNNGLIGVSVPAERIAWPPAGDDLRPDAPILPGAQVEVGLPEPSVEEVATWLLTWLPTFAVFLTVVMLLLSLVQHARRSDPFTRTTVRRLRVLAVVTLLGAAAAHLVEYLAEFSLTYAVLQSSAFSITYEVLPGPALLVGLAFLVIAEVVRRGCAMREELDTVI